MLINVFPHLISILYIYIFYTKLIPPLFNKISVFMNNNNIVIIASIDAKGLNLLGHGIGQTCLRVVTCGHEQSDIST